MKNKRQPVNKMRLLRRIYRLSVLLGCLPLTALAIIMTGHYVGEEIASLYQVIVLLTPIFYVPIRAIVIEVAQLIWALIDDESI